MMQTFDPTSNQPAFLKALELTNQIQARSVGGKLAMIPEAKVTMSPLTGNDDLQLKTIRTDIQSFNKMIDEMLYKHAKFEGVSFIDFEDFLGKLTYPDKQIMIALLLDATYVNLPEVDAICPNCKEINTFKPKVATAMSYEGTKIPEWDHQEPVWEKVFEKELDIDGLAGTIKVGIKYATEKDKDMVYGLMSNDAAKKNLLTSGTLLDSTDMLTMYIDYIEVIGPTTKGKKPEVVRLTNKVLDIQGFLDNAPLAIHDAIAEFIDETFKPYHPTFKHPVVCDKCHHNYDTFIDFESEFFRKAVPLY